VKKLLILIVLLVAGIALFAMPISGELPGVTSTIDMVEAAQQLGVPAAVTDVSPVMQAESLCSYINFEVLAITVIADRQEVNPFLGYSKTAVPENDNSRLTFEGWT